MCDIDMGQAAWTPIGTESNPFVGIFDGNGYCIKNIRIATSPSHSGLFGFNGGTIKNLGIENLTVLNYAEKSGGLAGENYGDISNCYVTGKISSTAYVSHVGGLAGRNHGTISNCYAVCEITSTATSGSAAIAGGLVGENDGNISNCYASVKIESSSPDYSAYAGGIVGLNSKPISNCFATGKISVTVSSKANARAGGIVGWTNNENVVNCWYGGMRFTVKKGSYSSEPTNIYGAETDVETLQTTTFQKETLGWDSNIWSFVKGQYPTLK